jgi:magnesium transporter
VIGIVAFGSINSGLTSKTDVEHLTYLWRRGGWLGFFFAMAISLIAVLIFTSRLDAVLAARGDLDTVPASTTSFNLPFTQSDSTTGNNGVSGDGVKRKEAVAQRVMSFARSVAIGWHALMLYITGLLEAWTGPKDDKMIAWTLGIGWACCGGGLAGGCLVFAKATYVSSAWKLLHPDLTFL